MSNVNNYLNLIEHNVRLLELLTGIRPQHLEKEDFSDWRVTIVFYISCIYIKAACSLLGIDIQDHFTLHSIINTQKEFLPISKYYRHIEEASRDARYEGRKFDKNFITKRILPKFNEVRDCAVSLIKQKGVSNITGVDIKPFLDRLL